MKSRKEERNVQEGSRRETCEDERELSKEKPLQRTQESEAREGGGGERDQAKKSVGRMPRHQEPKKDAESSETRRGDANSQRAADVRMGKPGWEKPSHCRMNK